MTCFPRYERPTEAGLQLAHRNPANSLLLTDYNLYNREIYIRIKRLKHLARAESNRQIQRIRELHPRRQTEAPTMDQTKDPSNSSQRDVPKQYFYQPNEPELSLERMDE